MRTKEVTLTIPEYLYEESLKLTSAGLRHPSALKPVLFTLDSARVIYRVGALTPADLAQVD